jgi:glycosyltransferase involved in cell wall biosynthesis
MKCGRNVTALTILFHRPPREKRVGGLELAIDELAATLAGQGADIVMDAGADEILASAPEHTVAWFHGLWQLPYPKLARLYQERGIAYVASPHGMMEPWALRHKAWKKIPYLFLCERAWLNRSSIIFSTGELETRCVRRWVSGPRIEELPLALSCAYGCDYLNARRELGWRESEIVLLYLSRIHVKKGLFDLVKGLLYIPAVERGRVRLVIVGDGPRDYVEKVSRLIRRQRGRLPVIEEVGPVWGERKWRYLQGADIFCLPTYSENFGLAVLEAALVGTPVFTTDHTPWRRYAGKKGFYISSPGAKSVADGIADALARYTWTGDDRLEFAGWASETFNWSRIGRLYMQAIKGLVRQ